jgi:hypothetical protein
MNGTLPPRPATRDDLKAAESTLEGLKLTEDYPGRADDIAEATKVVRQIRERSAPGRRSSGLRVTLASRVAPSDQPWLWEPWIPAGCLSLLEGRPGEGKTLVAIGLLARLSSGTPLPGEGRGRAPQRVAILSLEDNERTLQARLRAAGADLERVHLISAELDEGGRFDIASGASLIGEMIREERLALIVFDPITGVLPTGLNSWQDTAVREAFGPLLRQLGGTGCAVLGIRHLRKGPTHDARDAGLGSVAFTALARSVLSLGKHEERLVLASAKRNYARRGPALALEVIGEEPAGPAIVWGQEVAVSADELSSRDPDPSERAVLRAAEDSLRQYLAKGPAKAGEAVRYVCDDVQCSTRTVHRARVKLGVIVDRPDKPGPGSFSSWRLPQLAS